jgi:hypothetical protein
MSAIHEKIGAVVSCGLAQALKSAGYRKKGFNFGQDVSTTVVRLVNVQASQWNTAREGEFTINLGVYHRDLAELHDILPPVKSPKVYDCVIQQRIGLIMPERLDHWWSITRSTNIAALGAEVAEVWYEYGKPWLELHCSLKQAREFLITHNHFFLAAMASLALGQKREARQWVTRASVEWPGGADRIRAWRDHHLRSDTAHRK